MRYLTLVALFACTTTVVEPPGSTEEPVWEDTRLADLTTVEDQERLCFEYVEVLLVEGCPDTYAGGNRVLGGYPGAEDPEYREFEGTYSDRCLAAAANWPTDVGCEDTVGDVLSFGRESVIPALCDVPHDFRREDEIFFGPPGRTCVLEYR